MRTSAGQEEYRLALLSSQRLAEVLRSPGDSVLMRAMRCNLRQPFGNLLWRVEVWESLREVDRFVAVADAGHSSDDGIRKSRRACG